MQNVGRNAIETFGIKTTVLNIGQPWIVKETKFRPKFLCAERSEFIFYQTEKKLTNIFKNADLTKFSMTFSWQHFGQNLTGKNCRKNAFWNVRDGKKFKNRGLTSSKLKNETEFYAKWKNSTWTKIAQLNFGKNFEFYQEN